MMVYLALGVIALLVLLAPALSLRRAGVATRYLVVFTACALAAALLVYNATGSPELIAKLDAQNSEREKIHENITATLEALKLSPTDAASWDRLSDQYGAYGQWNNAVEAAKKAVSISGGQPSYITRLALAQYFAAGEVVSEEAKRSFQMVLLLEPENAIAPYFIGRYELQQGNSVKAREIWIAYLAKLNPASPYYKAVQDELARVPN